MADLWFDVVERRHLVELVANALDNHRRSCRTRGQVPPLKLDALLAALVDSSPLVVVFDANERQRRTAASNPSVADQDAFVDVRPVAVTYAEAGARLNVTRRTVGRWVAAGRLRTVGSGRGRRVLTADLNRLAS